MKQSIKALITSFCIAILITVNTACEGGSGGSGSADTNTPPIAYGRSLIVQSNSTVEFELGGKDADGDILTYRVQQETEHGILQKISITTWKYSPYIDYEGKDSFTFVANDGIDDSKPALVNIFIGAANHAPKTTGQVVSTDMNVSVAIILEATDEDEGDVLSYHIENGAEPRHGTLTQSPTEPHIWTYTPDLNYQGVDSFVYKVSDGFFESNGATVTITVSYINELPVANDLSFATDEGIGLNGTFSMTDPDTGDSLTASIVDQPAHGTLAHDGLSFTYTPGPYFNGTDSFTYKAYDGIAYSENPATVSITVNSINNTPSASDMTTAVLQGGSITFDLPGSDPDGDPLTYEILSSVSNGTLTQVDNTLPEVTYQSTAALGTVSFQYQIRDSSNTVSGPRTITIIVKQAGIIFVRASANGNNDGSSWYHAYNHPQDAIDGALDGDSIWIAWGTYYPEEGNSDHLMTVNKNVTIYGGFAGTENILSDRPDTSIINDSAANRTILNGDNSVKHIIVSHTDILFDKIAIQNGSSPVSGSPLLDTGGGLYHQSGNITINNCLFNNNNAVTGGGIYISGNTYITISNTTIENNVSINDGGGMYISANTSGTITDTTFSGNRTSTNGGGLLIDKESTVQVTTTLTTPTFTNNNAKELGGAICNLGNNTINNSIFTNNTAKHGGAVYDDNYGSSYTNCTFTNNGNSTTVNGGAIYTLGKVSILDLTFTGNTAQNGGALYTDESSIGDKGTIMITTSDFNGNTAAISGGAIYNLNSSAVFDRCDIGTNSGNTANQNGGAITNSGYGSPVIWFCTIENNNAENGGAIFNSNGTTPIFFGSRICNNTANFEGGAVYDYTDNNAADFITSVQYINCLIANNTQLQNGSVVIDKSKDIIFNSTIAYNISTQTGDFYAGIYMVNAGSLHIENSIIFNNPGTNNVLLHQIYYSSGDILTDAYNFILDSPGTETVFSSTNDYYLRTYPIGQASEYFNPCINTGNPVFSNVISSELYSIITNYGKTIDGRPDERVIDQGYHNPVSEILRNPITDYYHFDK